jgi:hypothetical protein
MHARDRERRFRLHMLLNLQAFESYKRAGVDLLGDHRDGFPPEYLRWVEEGQHLSALDFYRDQEIRTEIHHAFQGVLNAYDLLVTPTLACLPVDNADDGNTVGPSAINGEEVDPLIGWCLTYFVNFTGHTGGVDSGRPVRRPPGRDAGHRPAQRRRRRAGGQRGVRAAAAVARQLSAVPRAAARGVRRRGGATTAIRPLGDVGQRRVHADAPIRGRMHGRGTDSQTLITEAPTSFVNASRSGPAARHR